MKKLLINTYLINKRKGVLVLIFLITSCSSTTKLIKSWKIPEYSLFKPKKILVIGVDDNQAYGSKYSKKDYHLRHFMLYYFAYQDAYFKQDYYNRYKVFNIETSIYNLRKDSNKSLVWQASFDLIDPNNTTKTIDSYVKKRIKILEKENIIPKK